MSKYLVAAAALAAIGFAGAAYAGDDSNRMTNAAAPQAMSDSDLDKVTAGSTTVENYGRGDVPTSKVNIHAYENGFRGKDPNTHGGYPACTAC
jgi:hypothetical protein